MSNFLQGLFSEPSGKPSSKRVLNIYTNLVVVGAWAYISITTKTVAALSPELVALVVGLNGVGAYARGRESGKPDKAAETPHV